MPGTIDDCLKAMDDWDDRHAGCADRLKSAVAEVRRLRAAIKEHRDQTGDDRCHLDDQALYAAAGLEPADTALPCREEFLRSCERFWRQRQTPAGQARPPGRTIGQLEQEVARLAEENRLLGVLLTAKTDLIEALETRIAAADRLVAALKEAVTIAEAVAEFRKGTAAAAPPAPAPPVATVPPHGAPGLNPIRVRVTMERGSDTATIMPLVGELCLNLVAYYEACGLRDVTVEADVVVRPLALPAPEGARS